MLENTLIFSNLFGVVKASDHLPFYKFKQGAKINNFALEKFYKEHFSKALDEYLKNDILDYPDNLNVEIFDMNTLATQNLSKQKFDLITSNASLQWLDLKQVLPTLANMLNKKGILLLSTFGEMNLKEIKQSTSLGLKYFSTKELEQIFKPYFSDIKITEEIVNLEFQNALEVFRHLKLSGVNSLGFYRLNKQFLKEFEEKFQNKLTYHPIFILCKKDTK
ncbi:peroxide stress protein YaaA [Campylobacter coli]|nr:peroxide stress protein YaaA [Campylobacter coli]